MTFFSWSVEVVIAAECGLLVTPTEAPSYPNGKQIPRYEDKSELA